MSGKSYNPETGNTRKSKFSRNKTSTYLASKGGSKKSTPIFAYSAIAGTLLKKRLDHAIEVP